MADEKSAIGPAVQTIPIQAGFPSPDFPTIYVDGVTSLVPGAQVVKIYMGRVEPSLNAEPKSQTTAVLQLVMPANGFLQTAAFFNTQMQRMVREKMVTEEQVEAAKKSVGG